MSAKKDVRVRFAPSPTGNLHIGGMRTALFNWLFARHNKGTFLIRIEDTDLERSKKEYTEALIEALEWVGITSDEPLVFQSQRGDLYGKMVELLFQKKRAYRCVCTPEEIELRAKKSRKDDSFYKYDGHCKNKVIDKDSSKPFVVRFSLPVDESSIVFNDLIRGTVSFDLDQLDDFIILRSDGSPMYNFVVVIDDNAMNITHVIRAEEHLSNTPKQILLYQALEFALPEFAHIPLIMNADGQKMSKRDGDVDVLDYKNGGYLPDALLNYMVRLGWAHGDQEEFTKEELISLFTLDGVGKKGAIFDIQKLQWLNGVYIRKLSSKKVLQWLASDVEGNLMDQLVEWETSKILKGIDLYKERVKTGKELLDALYLLYDGPLNYNEDDIEEWVNDEEVLDNLELVVDILERVKDFSSELLSKLIKEFCDKHDIKLVSIAQPLRIALVGSASSPGVFDLLALVGKEESLMRIEALQTYKKSH